MAENAALKAAMPHALFRCDASPTIGGGHLSRCIAIAEALAAAGWRVGFAVGPGTVAMMPAATAADLSPVELSGDAEDEPSALRVHYPEGIDLLVVDHYQRDIRFEIACRRWARQILVMDDATGRQHDCDYLLDAGASDRSIYDRRVPENARLLLGPSCAVIGHGFIARRAEALGRRGTAAVKNILVSFGAADPLNVTSAVLEALDRYAEEISITVALSSQAPHLEEVRHKLHARMRLALDAEMPLLMRDADLAIGAAGASAYERAVLGLPSIIVTLAGNQRGVAATFTAAGAALAAGDLDAGLPDRVKTLAEHLIGNTPARGRMTEVAAALVDGRGAQRLLAALTNAAEASGDLRVRLRPAESDDRDFLLDLQRSPPTRRYARNPLPPTAEEHARWFVRTLADSDRFLSVIEVDGSCAGMIRLDRLRRQDAAAAFEISIAVCPQLHGCGIAMAALALARRLHPGAVFEAEVLAGNVASGALFRKAGFRQVSATRFRQWPHDKPSLDAVAS
jgi:UDP-2,4-diacetamido-2,4,6-trideoxy-beta-L-altropyranose hydrolase